MEIAFDTEELLNLCIDESLVERLFCPEAAGGLRNRLDDMRAADSVLQLPAGRPRRDLCDGVDCYRVEFYKDLWLTIIPNHLEPRMNAQGATDWGRVRRVRIVSVGELE